MTYRREEAYRHTLEYFNGDSLAANVWLDKYALKDSQGNIYELTPEDMHKRIAKELARIEMKYPNPLSEEMIFYLMDRFRYIVTQGSPMYGIGNDFVFTSLSNCFVIDSAEDSYGGIMKTDQEQVQLMKRRGGVGHDLSTIRPSGASANNSVLGDNAGMPLYMERFSNSTREVSQDGRRGALMLSADIRHPDAEKFIDAKLEQGKVTGANISVKISDDFIEAVKNDDDFWQTFPVGYDISGYVDRSRHEYDQLEEHVFYEGEQSEGKIVYIKRIKAKRLWNKIIHNAWKSAEPGVLFWDKILSESPAGSYGEEWKEKSTNPCGEIPLCQYDSCRLTAINLFSYVENPFTDKARFNYDKFKKHVNMAQRLMDDIVDLEIEKLDRIIDKIQSDPESEDVKRVEIEVWQKIREKAIQGRRTGLGVTAEGDMLAALGLIYGTDEASDFSDELHKTLAIESYKSSIEMAKERGAFPIWDYEKEKDNPFIDRILENIEISYKSNSIPYQNKFEYLEDYFAFGRRNISNLTIAPTGTVSILTQTTSGIEPAFKVYYKRRRKTSDRSKAEYIDEVGDMWEEHKVFHHKFVEWYNTQSNLDPNSFKYGTQDRSIYELSEDELKYVIEQSPYYKATSEDVDYIGKVELQGRVQKWVDHSISVTVNMPEDVSEETVSKVYMRAHEVGCKGVTVYREGSRSGVLISDKKDEKKETEGIIYNQAPKRPKTLICDIYNISRNKQPFTIVVGLLDGKPYEIFALEKIANCDFNDKISRGELKKVRSKTYQLSGFYNGKKYIVDNIVDFMSPDEQKNTRHFSTQLRHGIHPKYIVDQINEYALITSFDKVIAKTLSNYLDGERLKGEESCPNCGGELRHETGCVQCVNPECGYSKCS